MMNTANSTVPILLFDGDCAFCNGCVRWLLQHERRARFHFAALQSITATTLLTEHGITPGDLSSLVVIDGGVLYRKSNAVLHLLRETRWPWRMLRILTLVPRWLRDVVYDFIGRHRYQWWGRAETCLIADENIRARITMMCPKDG